MVAAGRRTNREERDRMGMEGGGTGQRASNRNEQEVGGVMIGTPDPIEDA